jgi:hypothetical protein
MPVSRKKSSPANISGTKFWAMKAVMGDSSGSSCGWGAQVPAS